ncbi:hypothetical protein TRFO_16846 [Tritrichomonas foetus]|uniref:Uncharacterized protein n=1 Tax=Tritrichomonas foetus TaxID=1144522 RepID=A0A1J4KPK5_9EUKA|nr:hypothetical protein TRFO_16846 [Tritrichomonas foetus]|eukprot:OHT13171.1 hypothetical protein TRFO_16846 [Tritrichomonas foetus]
MRATVARTPKSTTLKKTKRLNTPKGRFAAILDQRKANLNQQKQKLGLAKSKLENDQREVDEEMKKILEQQKLVSELEADLKSLDPSVSILSENFHPSLLKQQMTMLQKTEADLKQQLIIAQRLLEESSYQLRASDNISDDPDVVRSIENEFKQRSVQVKMLRELLDTLKCEILSRENEVILLEVEAVQHRKEVNEKNQVKEDLMKRRKGAEMGKRNIVIEIRQCEQLIRDLSNKQKKLKTEMTSAESERDRLDNLEKDLTERENQSKQKREELEKLKYDLNQARIIRVQNQVKEKDEKEEKEFQDLRNPPPSAEDQEKENADFEIQLASEERSLDLRAQKLNIEKETQNRVWDEKKQKILSKIQAIEDKLQKNELTDELKANIEKAKSENENLKKEIDARKAEIEELRKQILSDEEVSKMRQQLQGLVKETLIEEREVNSKLFAIQSEERDLNEDEKELRQNKAMLEADINLTKKHDASINSMINICQKQLEDVKKKYEIAVAHQNINETYQEQ